MKRNSTRGFEGKAGGDGISQTAPDNLERLCRPSADGIRVAPPEHGIERIEARFQGNGFSPHRHDTYAIGLTLSGVQSFWYRGEQRASLPGQVIVIHPDELHDGGAGTAEGLRYRMIYLAPEQVSATLSEAGLPGLPFVAAPVLSDRRFRNDLADALSDIGEELGSLKRDGLMSDLAACLSRHADHGGRAPAVLNRPGLRRCAAYLRENCAQAVRMEELETLAQQDRFTLSRQFRRAFGTSPHRYLVMRRLDRAKTLLAGKASLVEAAISSGFADQSHMTRHFKKVFGMTPGQWRNLAGAESL